MWVIERVDYRFPEYIVFQRVGIAGAPRDRLVDGSTHCGAARILPRHIISSPVACRRQ
jgi:hypothetical protein